MAKTPTENKRSAFFRFGLTGVVFTFLGPYMFWLAYPLGPLLAVGIAELSVHSVRFIVFRYIVFPARKGYNVNLKRYLIAILPVSLAGFLCVALFRNHLDRISLTLTAATLSLVIGFLWSRSVYIKPVSKRSPGPPNN
jgi:putative flippase GtrA